ncbi:MAG: hypothetical protein KDD64_14680 [Bdellovibrionales bacterium]|nr:hypothetical protein [Bdellovibrionales bacterium]
MFSPFHYGSEHIVGDHSFERLDQPRGVGLVHDEDAIAFKKTFPNGREVYLTFFPHPESARPLVEVAGGNGILTVVQGQREVGEVYSPGVFDSEEFERLEDRFAALFDAITLLPIFRPGERMSLQDEKEIFGLPTEPHIDSWVTVKEFPTVGRKAVVDLHQLKLRPYQE